MPRRQFPEVERDVTSRNPKLEKVGFVVVQPELGPAGRSDERAGTDLDLEIATWTRVEGIAGGEGCVYLRRRPV
jgi:hypothetical protein